MTSGMRKLRAITCSITAAVLLASGSSHAAKSAEAFCGIEGPRNLVPPTIHKLHFGMKPEQIEKVLGKPDYSPTRGQYYFFTGGTCEVVEALQIPCGFVLNFANDQSADDENPSAGATLEGCWWGPIGE